MTNAIYGRTEKCAYTVVHDSFKSEFCGKSKKAISFAKELRRVAKCEFPVLFLGESGAGKTFAAKTVHSLSARRFGQFFDVNVSAVADDFVESELFGVLDGAFTDAKKREGYFSCADGGSLFLDEIGDATISMQKKLLKVVETGEFRRLGSSKIERTDVRLMFATNANLRALIKKGDFREDLFYRIATLVVECPSLRQMREDIPDFCKYHLAKKNCHKVLSDSALDRLVEFDWPGNFRQLQSTLDRATVFCDGDEISADDIVIY